MRAMQLQLRRTQGNEQVQAPPVEARTAEERARASEAATRQANGALEDARECRTCFAVFDSAAHAQAALLPCAHVMCVACTVRVRDSPGRHCHVCRVTAEAPPVRLYIGNWNRPTLNGVNGARRSLPERQAPPQEVVRKSGRAGAVFRKCRVGRDMGIH